MKKQVFALSVLALGLAAVPARADFKLLLRDVTTGGTDTQVNNCNEAETIIALAVPNATYNFTDTEVTRTVIDVAGGGGNFGTNDPLPDGATGQGKEDYILNAKAYVRIPAGDWSIGFGSDDGGRLRVDGITFLSENNTNGDPVNGDNEVFFNGTRGHGWTWGTFTLSSQLDTTLDALQFERGGGDSFEIAIYAGHAGSAPASWVLLQDGAGGWTVSADPLIDTTPPSIAELSPADDATGVNPGANLVVTFDENIALTSSGTVSIVNRDASTQVDITLPNPQVTVSGTDLAIVPTNGLGFGTNYAIRISSDAVADLWAPPNVFAGITNDTTWNFTIAELDLTAPVIANTVPADDASGVTPNANLVAVFDDGIVAGSGNIVIYNVTDSTNLTTIAVTNASQVSISGNVLTIDPDVDLTGAKEFAVRIDAGAVENYSGVTFAGIGDTATWSFSVADTTTFTGPNRTNGDNWSVPGNWDLGIPSGVLNAVIPTGKQVTSDGGSAQAYSGNLTIGTNAYLQIGWVNPRHEEDFNALGTPVSTTVFMQDGSHLHFRAGSWGTVDIPAIELQGNASLTMNTSTEPASNYRFPYGINGPHTFTLKGKGNQDALLTTSNTLSELVFTSTEGSYDVFAEAELSLNGDVTVDVYNGLPAADLTINATNAIADTATLGLNGSASVTLLTMNADDTVSSLTVSDFPFPAGTYGRVGTPATADYEVNWLAGDSVLTVSSAPADSSAPVLTDIACDSGNGDNYYKLVPLTCTLTFDEAVTSSVTVVDFENVGSAMVSIDSVTQTDLNEFEVVVTASSTGTLTLRVESSASFHDLFGNSTTGPITDDETFTVIEKPPVSPLYEPFDYAAGQGLSGLNGGTGWGGAWSAPRSNPTVTALNNTWGDLLALGGRINPPSWSIIYRPIGTTLHHAGLMSDGSTLWFAFVVDILNQNLTNLDYNFALCSGNFVNDYAQKGNLLNNSEGIGVGNYRPDFMAAYWQDTGDADGYGERATSSAKLTLNSSDNSRALIVGKIEWGADGSTAEKITLYAPGKDLVLPAPFVDAWETPALNQSLFDRISIQWKDSQPSIDEIRFGASYDEVIGAAVQSRGTVMMIR